MNTKQSALCDAKYRVGDYNPSPEWQKYEGAWQAYHAAAPVESEEDYQARAAIAASYTVWEVERYRSSAPAPTMPEPRRRIIEKFEYRWLERHHPPLARYHAYTPSKAELFGEQLWAFMGKALLIVLVIFIYASCIGAVVRALLYDFFPSGIHK